LHRLGRHDEALEAIEQALALDASDGGIWCEKGRVLSALQQYEEGLAAFDQSLAIDAADADTWEGKAAALRALAREDEAVVADEQARALREPRTSREALDHEASSDIASWM
jgi:tetratricopeptide (TPR) repeat protein